MIKYLNNTFNTCIMTLHERNIKEIKTIINEVLIIEQKVPHFSPEDEPLGELSALQQLKLRVYIAQRRLTGYYFIYDNEKIIINKKGDPVKWPSTLYNSDLTTALKELWETNKVLFPLDMRVTNDNIQELKVNEVFVFGSNEAGIHGAGAAKLAHEKFGAVYRKGWGHYGNSYAIPTKDKNIKTLSIEAVRLHVNDFIKYTQSRPELTFLVTEIGCGLAGHRIEDIAPLFNEVARISNIHLPLRFWNVLLTNL